MNQARSITPLAALLAALALPAVGCRRPTPPPPPDPNNWKGEASIDPAGDLQKLQGRWEQPPWKDSAGVPGEAWIEVDGDTITYRNRSRTVPDFRASYRFVVNSAANPKILRCIEWLGPGQPLPGHGVPRAEWYSLDGDTLTLWDKWADYGEQTKISYHRAKDKK